MPEPILAVSGVSKTYKGGFTALHSVDLTINKGEIFALLGPNGAGKTTLISIICGIVTPSTGTIHVAGHDAITDYKAARRRIGLVPQELSVDMFETVLATVTFSRRLFGRSGHSAYIEQILRDLSLWDKRDAKIMELSGGMKRRVLIAKALSHEPDVLFLDEPTAGVDVSLRRDMWKLVHKLRDGRSGWCRRNWRPTSSRACWRPSPSLAGCSGARGIRTISSRCCAICRCGKSAMRRSRICRAG